MDAPQLRIVSEEAFEAVRRRFETTQKLWGTGIKGLARGQQKQLTKLRALLASPGAVHEARALLAEQLGKMTLERVADTDQMAYRAK